MKIEKTVAVILSLMVMVSVNCPTSGWAGPLEEKLMKEFGSLYPESNQTSESAIKEIKALLDQKAN